MSIRSLQDYTYYSKYARYNHDEGRRETWAEAVDRVKQMHLRKYAGLGIEEDIEWAFEQVRQKRVLGSQRALQFGGTPIERKNARMYNCTVSFCDRPRFFQEAFWLLLCGCGTGFSVQKHHVAKIPDFSRKSYENFKLNGGAQRKTFVIPDTIEGWADALGILIASYIPHPEFPEWEGVIVDYDFSQIRPEGSYLSSGAGKAPGPGPLIRALDRIRELLHDRSSRFDRLRPIDAYDVMMHASDAVLSGGVRRSASICIFSPDDEEMINAKTGNWLHENPQRGRSNNSAMLVRDETSREDFLNLIASVKEYGEPGFYWSDSTEQLPNPCVEIGMWPVHWLELISGWQFCNLSTMNGKKIKSLEDFKIAARAAAIIGTLQAGYTSFEYLGRISEEIAQREALLGVSITGMMDNPEIIYDPKIQRAMAKVVVDTNAEFAEKIGINPAARTTCIKPEGTSSCVLGSASGTHPHHARRYFRRVQANRNEPVFQYFRSINPNACEKSVWAANETDEIITFCIEVPDGAKTKNDMGAVELLEHVKSTQINWVNAGKRKELCTQEWLTHNVSNTINVREDEWEDVASFIYRNRKWFSGVALLPQSGDLDYPQAPLCNVLTPREILREYGDCCMLASGLIVDGLYAFDGDLWKACDAAMGLGEPIETPVVPSAMERRSRINWESYKQTHAKSVAKMDWIRRVEQFAERYCEGDVRKCCRLMKHVNNWKVWMDLNRVYQDVDYTQLFEEADTTKPLDTVACAGGACEVSYA